MIAGAMSEPLVSIKRKFDGTTKQRWPCETVETSADWLVVFYDHPGHETAAGEPVTWALGYFAIGRPLVVLVSFDAAGAVLQYQCDAALPCRRLGQEIHWVDLDLDVLSGPELAPHIRDFDDFARNSRAMAYDAAAIAAAGDGVNLALGLLLARDCPFDGSPASLLERTLAARGRV